jgi:HAD superfamily hydrolase (TIGR01509 family)
MEVFMNINLEGKKALFVDVDGTLADTMGAHDKAYELAFALNGVPFSLPSHKFFAPMGGDILMQKTVIEQRFSQEVADKIVKDKQELLSICLRDFMRPNLELVKFIKECELPTIIVSNGRKRSIVQILERLGLLWHVGGIICKEEYKNAKPHPDPYLVALELMEVEPHEVVVFEDNEVGITAAKAAGITDIVEVKTDEF